MASSFWHLIDRQRVKKSMRSYDRHDYHDCHGHHDHYDRHVHYVFVTYDGDRYVMTLLTLMEAEASMVRQDLADSRSMGRWAARTDTKDRNREDILLLQDLEELLL